jgi:DNA-binding NtrC family response regulator
MNAKPTILLVEDDPALRTMLGALLEMRDYRVLAAEQRSSALTLLRSEPQIGVVILDFGLPPHAHDMREGVAMLADIEAGMFNVKVIVLTGQDEASASLAAIRAGAFDFLSKPVGADPIVGAVERACLFRQREQQLSAEGIHRIAVNTVVGDGLKNVRADAEERLVRQVLKDTDFNVVQSARRLGIKRENIYYLMKKFGIARDD